MRATAATLVTILLLAFLAGCSTAPSEAPPEASPLIDVDSAPRGEPPATPPASSAGEATAATAKTKAPGAPPVEISLSDDGAQADVPVDVVLVGFPLETAQALQSAFGAPYGEHQITLASLMQWDLDDPRVLGGGYAFNDAALQHVSHIDVHLAPASDLAGYLTAVSNASGPWNGNAVAPWLDDALVRWSLDQRPIDPLVIVHAGTTGHTYDLRYSNGHWPDARVFGGDAGAVLMDVSAGADPWTGETEAYMAPIGPSDAEALVPAVQHALRFRLTQGPLYPIPIEACHAVTLVYAVYTTGELGVASGIRADEAVDVDLLKAAFEELTSEPVHVDLVRLDLPQDDAALYAWLRMVSSPEGQTSYNGQEMARAWIDANWEDYHVPHDGCAEYLSLLVWSDAAESRAYGIAEYDGQGRRFSFSMVPEAIRGIYEPGPVGGLYCCKPSNIDSFQFVNMLFAHETGHLFGQAHPHNSLDEGPDGLQWTFSSTRTVMSYLTDQLDISFGTQDQDNWHRNRVGYMVQALAAADLLEAAAEAGFVKALEQGQWRQANTIAQQTLGLV